MAEFRIFPDIRLIVGRAEDISSEDVIEISFCRVGVCEYLINGDYYYLTAQKGIIVRRDNCSDCRISYSSDYCGITLLIDSNYNCNALSEILDMPDIFRNMQSLKQCGFVVDDNIQRLFSDISDTSGTSILRIKVLELLMLMGEKRSTTSERSGCIRKIGIFIGENLCEHYTIAHLSELFKIDQTTLKSLFRQTWGCPVYTYTKSRKMFRAAELLRDTEMKVIDIAEEVGYCNASKFSSAFRDVIGTTPKNYQMEHKKMASQKECNIS